jgi:hypothetical protein
MLCISFSWKELVIPFNDGRLDFSVAELLCLFLDEFRNCRLIFPELGVYMQIFEINSFEGVLI